MKAAKITLSEGERFCTMIGVETDLPIKYVGSAQPATCTVDGHTFELWPGDEIDISTDPPTVHRAEALQGGGQ